MRNQEGGRAATTRHNRRRCGLVATVFTAMAATGLAAPTPVVYGGGSHAHLLTSSTHRVGPLLSPPAGPGLVTTPEAHGAVGDGKANDWAPVQAALAACVEQPSCKVVFAKICEGAEFQLQEDNHCPRNGQHHLSIASLVAPRHAHTPVRLHCAEPTPFCQSPPAPAP